MHTGNVNKVRVIAAIAIVTALVTTTSLTMTIAPDVYAYKKYQAASQASACGNDEVPINVGCQNIYSQIRGNENVVSLTAQQTFPASVTPSPSPPPPPPRLQLNMSFSKSLLPVSNFRIQISQSTNKQATYMSQIISTIV